MHLFVVKREKEIEGYARIRLRDVIMGVEREREEQEEEEEEEEVIVIVMM